MITGAAFLDDFTPPSSHHPNDHEEARNQGPQLALFDAEQALHIHHAANREGQHRNRANQWPWRWVYEVIVVFDVFGHDGEPLVAMVVTISGAFRPVCTDSATIQLSDAVFVAPVNSLVLKEGIRERDRPDVLRPTLLFHCWVDKEDHRKLFGLAGFDDPLFESKSIPIC